MAVQVGGLSLSDTETNAASGSGLLGAFGVYTLALGGATYAYVTGHEDDSLSVFALGADDTLTRIQTIHDGGTALELNGAAQIVSAQVGGSTYLYVNAAIGDGISIFRVNANGTLTNTANVRDDETLELNGPEGKMAVASVGEITYLISPGDDDNGVGVFRINDDGTLTSTYTVTDGGSLQLHSASDAVVVVAADGGTYTYIAGEDDPGISAFRLNADGTLTNIQNIHDDATLELAGTAGLTTATVAGVTYVIASGAVDDGLSVFVVGATGQLSSVFNITDTEALGLKGAMGLTAFTLDTETFVAVSAMEDDALSIFHLRAGGGLTNVTTLIDSADLPLDGTYFNSFATVGGTPYLLATGRADSGVSVFDIGSGNDMLTGTATADVLLGLRGHDTLNGAEGDDRLIGGTGDDTYVVDSAGDEVVEQANGGTDTVQASVSYTLVADVENLTLIGTAALDGTGNGLNNQITGNTGANRLLGKAGRDDLEGGKQADTLLGGKGKDTLAGQGGSDDFVFTSLKDSGTSKATRDIIEDFRGRDDVALTRIDANKGQRGNQAFELDTNGSFDAGEIRFRDTRAGVLVEINVDADARAEMSILVRGSGTLDVNDFEF